MMQDVNQKRLNFLIDYSDADLPWVEWIARQLEDANYTVKYRERDFRPGTNIVQQMEQAVKTAEHLLIVLSPDYLRAHHENKTFSGVPVWTSELYQDKSGKKRKVLPVRVRRCRLQGILAPIITIDLFELNELEARNILLTGVSQDRPQLTEKPIFPGSLIKQRANPSTKPGFPPLYRPPIWHVPPDNPFFTDREYDLTQIHSALQAGQEDRIHTHVINGLGGVGKTQVALAYAHNYKHLYEAVLWADASTHNTLISSLITLADALKFKLSRADKQNDQQVISAMKQWLETQMNWLLILDNIEDPRSAQDLIPSIGNGHILFTARMQATGTIASSTSHLNELKPEDGALLLLRRAKKLEVYDTFERSNENTRKIALKLSYVLGNLPLMLDQAGAYIEEANIDVLNYLEYYSNNKLRHALLRWRGDMTSDHLESVSETWNHAFEIVQHVNPAAYDLLRFCTFLSPEDIPEEIIIEGASRMLPTLQPFAQDPLQKDQAIAILRRYSLLNQNADMRTFSMNRIVQLVLRDKMNEAEQLQWVEQVIAAVHFTLEAIMLPDANSAKITHCPRYHPHVETCACHMKDWNITSAESASMLHLMGRYLHDYARNGSHDPSLPTQLTYIDIVSILENYVMLLRQMNQPGKAEELVQFAESIRALDASNV